MCRKDLSRLFSRSGAAEQVASRPSYLHLFITIRMPTKTYHLGLIGYPLGHSLSPKIHGAAFQALGVPGKYKLYPVSPKPDTTHQQAKGIVDPGAQAKLTLVDLLTQMREGQIHGLNVTIPHKQNVIPYLDELTPAAETIGAVNTIFVQADRLIGENTDAPRILERSAEPGNRQPAAQQFSTDSRGWRFRPCRRLCFTHPRLPRQYHSPTNRTSARTLQAAFSDQ
jgi:hypothetical protein